MTRLPATVVARRGFTLLEVLVAIAILDLGMTVLLSAQVGLFSGRSAQNERRVQPARCKMSAGGAGPDQDRLSPMNKNDEGSCADQDDTDYQCSWKIERVELRSLDMTSGGDGGATTGGLARSAAWLRSDASSVLGGVASGGLGSRPRRAAAGVRGGAAGDGFSHPAPADVGDIRKVTVKVAGRRRMSVTSKSSTSPVRSRAGSTPTPPKGSLTGRPAGRHSHNTTPLPL